MKRIGIFWDYENCSTPRHLSGYSIAGNIRRASGTLGDEISIFKAYVDVHLESSSKTVQQTELQASGVTFVHCPHASRKEVADRVLLVDLVVFALECKEPSSIVLITGDRDFSYAISMLRMKGHDVFIILPSAESAHYGLQHLATGILPWRTVLQCEGSSLNFEKAMSSSVRASQNTALGCLVQQAPAPPSILPPPCSLSSLSISSKLALPTPITAVLANSKASGRRSVLVDTTNRLTSSNDGVSNVPPIIANTYQLLDTVQSPSKDLLQNMYANAHSSTASSTSHRGFNTCGPAKSISDSNELSRTVPSSASKVSFVDLIQILLAERAKGQMSTPCSTLDGILRKTRPTIYQEAGVANFKEYLELAQSAGVVFFSDVVWDNCQGWVSLRNPQDYRSRRSCTSVISHDKQTLVERACVTTSSCHTAKSMISDFRAGVLKTKHLRPATSAKDTQQDSDSRFGVLITVMHEFRDKGAKRVRETELYLALQGTGSLGERMNRKQARTLVGLARKTGVIFSTASNFVELHTDFY